MIKLIAAMDKSGLLGYNNTIPWSYLEDMKRFKKLTTNGILIMGKNTVLSLPRKLSKRYVIGIAHDNYPLDKADITFNNFSNAVQHALEIQVNEGKDIWIAGGGNVYRQAIIENVADELYITYVPEVEVPDNAYGVVCFPIYMLNGYQVKQSIVDGKLVYTTFIKK